MYSNYNAFVNCRAMKLNLLISALIGAAYLVSQTPAFALTKEEYYRLSNQCHEYVLAQRFDEAMRAGLPLTRSPYADARLYVDLADCYRQEWGQHSMQVDPAKNCCRQAIALNPAYGHAYQTLGQIASVQTKQDDAVKLFTKALSVSQPDVSGLYHRAKAYASLHRYSEALTDLNAYENYLKVHCPNDHTSVLADNVIRGQIYQASGQYDLAAIYYKKSFPKFKSEWTQRQILDCLIKANKLPDAIDELTNRITKDKQDDQSYFLRAGLEMRLKKFNEAINDYTSAIQIEPTSTYYIDRAKAYEQVGKTDLAKKDIEKTKLSDL